jgi:hypothetical protein
MMMFRRMMVVVALVLWSIDISRAQNPNQNKTQTDQVALFQTFFEDAPIAADFYWEGFFQYLAFEGDISTIDLAAQGAFPVGPQTQVGGAWAFRNISPGNSGLTDLVVSGRHNISQAPAAISIGALMTLPIGSKDIDESNFNFSGFGALRYPLVSGQVLTGALGLEFVEQGSAREAGLLLAGGVIVPAGTDLHFIGEINIRSRSDYALISGGVDYVLQGIGGKIRGALGLGVDAGAPDFAFHAGYFLGF